MVVDPISSTKFETEGNTSLKLKTQISPAKYWCFTLNNYSENDLDRSIVPILIKLKCDYIIGKEIGESGTPHLQGFVKFRNKVRPKNLFISSIHWEKCKGSEQDNINYCTKDNNYITNMKIRIPEEIELIDPTKDWQKKILLRLLLKPDKRDILWFYGPQGIGKTQFCKWLVVKRDAIVLSGSPSNMKNGIVEYMKENNGCTPEIIISNLSYDCDMEKINYKGYEDIKDMLFYSGKYEGKMVCGNAPHLLVFSNDRPNTENQHFVVSELQ